MGFLSDDGEVFDNAFSVVLADRCGVAAKSPAILNGVLLGVNPKVVKYLELSKVLQPLRKVMRRLREPVV
jgi:hypothetical protein